MALRGNTTVGIDIGTSTSIIAYVCKNGVDIVQNEVSQRQTATVVGFNDRERLLGDSASTVMKSNFRNTVRNFRHIMGPSEIVAEQLTREQFWQLAESCEDSDVDGAVGYRVNYRGEEKVYSATQIMGMFLTKMKDTAENWCQSKVIDVVISVPSYFNDFQRQAMLDAAAIAGLNCLRLMNEHTATALAYGIYRTKDFDVEKPTVTAFAHLGHSTFSISICSFTQGKLNVLAEVNDVQCAGREMEKVLVEHFGNEFGKKYGCEPLNSKKAKLKLEDAVTKCKKILSANDEASVGIECLMEDEDLNSKVSREKFEELCAPLQQRVRDAIAKCLAESGLGGIDEINFVEIIGGASRVPWFQNIVKEMLGKELSKTLNADECIARGCALMAAILSPAYKVRDFQVEDKVPHGVTITWMGSKTDTTEADKDGDEPMQDANEAAAPAEPSLTQKSMEVFSAAKDKMNQRRYITWFRNGPFDLGAQYSHNSQKIGNYQIQLEPQTEKKKIKIEAKMSIHGIFSVDSAHIVEIEEYEEVVKEKREIVEPEPSASPDGDAPMPDANGAEKQGENGAESSDKKESETTSAEGGDGKKDDAAPEKKEEKKEETKKPKYEWVEVKKPKKRTKRIGLSVSPSGQPGTSEKVLDGFKDIESKLQTDTREVAENNNRRNDLESYIYSMREKVTSDSAQCREYLQADARAALDTDLQKAEDWLYDHFDASTVELCDKLAELQAVGKPVMKRHQDREDVKNYLPSVSKVLGDVRAQASNPSDEYYSLAHVLILKLRRTFAHIASEKKQNLTAAADQIESWVASQQSALNAKPLHEEVDAAFTVSAIQGKLAELTKQCKGVMSEPKPAPPPAPVAAEGEHAAEAGSTDTSAEGGAGKEATTAGAEDAAMGEGDSTAAETGAEGAKDTTSDEAKPEPESMQVD
eukprot:g6262.t1